MSNTRIWEEYYDHFSYFNKDDIRKGCQPLIMDWGEKRDNSIVLIHGLTDSPYFMKAIGQRFHEQMGFNVLIPLLQGHGLNEPNGMAGVSLEEWKRNVEFAIETAKELGTKVSIGGLSTGGALSVYMALKNPAINGAVFLFSAALDLAGIEGNIKEILLRTPIANILDFFEDKDLISKFKKLISEIFDRDKNRKDQKDTAQLEDNPYRYSKMDLGGAQQLSRLIKEIDKLTGGIGKKTPLHQPLFVAHSEYDRTANIQGVVELLIKANSSKNRFFRIGQHFHVPHASVVLEEPVKAEKYSPLEPSNPFFNEMISSVHEFVKEQLSG